MKTFYILIFGIINLFYLPTASAQYTNTSVYDNGGQQIGFVTCTDCNPTGLGDPVSFIHDNLNSLPEVNAWFAGDLVLIVNTNTGVIGGWARAGFAWVPLNGAGSLSGTVQGIINSQCYLCVPSNNDE